jgi:replication factor A1
MKLIELKPGQGKVDVEVLVKSKDATREFEKYGKQLRVANAIVSDDSGEIKMGLWNEDIDKVKVGDKIKVTNGYVSEFNGIKQLSAGKFGKIEVVNGSASVPAVKESKPGKSAGQAMDELTGDKKSKKKIKDVEDVEF